MTKSGNKSSNRITNKPNNSYRSKPMTPRAGVRNDKRRYENGGYIK